LPDEFGPNAPKSIAEVLEQLDQCRKQGYCITEETYTAGLNAMAAPVALAGQQPMATISIAGPSARFNSERMLQFAPALLECASQLAAASGASPMLTRIYAP
jgi:DNA-binding IclR family transcriptional regulator